MTPSQASPRSRPARIAIVGSGPSGFYTAAALFKQKEQPIEVDFFDRLPTPYGLVRGGVAPDHQNIKAVIRVYDKLARRDQLHFQRQPPPLIGQFIGHDLRQIRRARRDPRRGGRFGQHRAVVEVDAPEAGRLDRRGEGAHAPRGTPPPPGRSRPHPSQLTPLLHRHRHPEHGIGIAFEDERVAGIRGNVEDN